MKIKAEHINPFIIATLETFDSMVRAFSGSGEVGDAEVIDAVGELANIIAGAAKKDLSHQNISISLPTVVTGKGHGINGPADTVNMVAPFESEHGRFDLAISFKSLA